MAGNFTGKSRVFLGHAPFDKGVAYPFHQSNPASLTDEIILGLRHALPRDAGVGEGDLNA